jgi:SAM-dependent methyltransferase
MSEWEGYILKDYEFHFDQEALVLDVGCGQGNQMKQLIEKGSSVIGIELELSALDHCRSQGLSVVRAYAEQVPLKPSCLDGILCKVVLPYTHEEQVISEFGRLLKPGGRCYLICHGAGYYLEYLLLSPSLKRRFYGLRSLLNTWVWIVTGRRLPGFLGDTIYQSRRRLSKYFQVNNLSLLEDTASKRFLGFPVFTYQLIKKIPHEFASEVT